jgi:hypothetical protein
MVYVQFPYDTLSQLGADLVKVSEQLGQNHHGAADCNGLSGEGQHKIQNAIEHFRDEWKTSFRKLNEDIENWGGLSKAIGDMVSQFDVQVAEALSPKGTDAP